MEEPINIVDVLAQDALKRCFKVYGIEGTEDKIKEICLPVSKNLYECQMRNYNILIGRPI